MVCSNVINIRFSKIKNFTKIIISLYRLIRVFAGIPLGCVKMKRLKNIHSNLDDLKSSPDTSDDVKDELNVISELIKPLEKPQVPTVEGI